MDYKLLHNGNNITDSIKVSQCYTTDRFGGTLDDLAISFATSGHTIEFNENDEIEIQAADGYTTGVMYLDSCGGKDGKFTIKALSNRHKNKKKESKIWNQVTLYKIIGDVSESTGLKVLLYGVKDYPYKSVAQINETKLQLLSRLCKREGYSVKCDNGNLIVFNEHYLESNSKPIEISKDSIENNYYFEREPNALTSLTVRCFNTETMQNISFTAEDKNISGGNDTITEFLSSYDEAQRFAFGYLRNANKLYISGNMRMAYNGKISAGTVADLTGFEEFDGRYVIYEVSHDLVNDKTYIKVRKFLNY